MSVALKVSLGTVNFTDWLHVTATKVSDPGSGPVWETWIDVPVTNYNFVIPGLDPENYYIRYYDSPTNSALGTLKMELLVNAMTSEFIHERRFYTTGGGGVGDPADGDSKVIDPYFQGKTITGVMQLQYGYLKPTVEWNYDDPTFTIEVITGHQFTTDEVFVVEITYAVAATNTGGSSGGGIYTGTKTITAATETLLAADANKRIRLKGTAATQVIQLPTLASVSVDKGFLFDHSVQIYPGGPVQVSIQCNGTDRIRYNGFCARLRPVPIYLFDVFWVSIGEHLMIKKVHDDEDNTDYWEVVDDYAGIQVGNKMASSYRDMPNWIAWDGSLYDGDEYPRLWWWLNNILPISHKYFSTNVLTGAHYDLNKAGMFALHPTLKKFRTPFTMNMGEMSLSDYNGASDSKRAVNWPGGYQADSVGPHAHPYKYGRGGGIDTTPSGGAMLFNNANNVTEVGWVLANTGTDRTVHKNVGVCYLTHI